MSRLAGYKEEIGRLEDLALEAGTRLGDPQLFESLQILTAIEKIPEYSFYSQRVLLPSKEGIQLKPEQIRAELHKIHSNRAALAHTEGGGFLSCQVHPTHKQFKFTGTNPKTKKTTHTPA